MPTVWQKRTAVQPVSMGQRLRRLNREVQTSGYLRIVGNGVQRGFIITERLQTS
jgi:hypothetical protein